MGIVYIFGTSHRYQYRDAAISESFHEAFTSALKGLLDRHEINGIAEECSRDGLNENSVEATTVQILAQERGLPHRYCDPDRKTRDKREILQINDIRMQGFMSNATEDDINREIQKHNRLKEQYWTEQLLDFNVWPVLFVCGADHVRSFLSVLQANGLVPSVATENWGT